VEVSETNITLPAARTATLAGQVAIVTGGAGGLGRVIARELGAAGAAVMVADVAEEAAKNVADELAADGLAVTAQVVDVTNPDSVTAMVEAAALIGSGVQILVNTAGFPMDRPLVTMDDDAWHRVLSVCLYGTFACCRAVAPSMIERRYGRIINLASRAYLGNPGQANYSAAKAGVVGLTKALAKELGRHEITVNAVAPGIIATDTVAAHPKFEAIAKRAKGENSVRRLGEPEDVAHAVAYFASPGSSFVTGDILHVSGGRFG
jgi:3-oxoacyl-[acyl-carrier protein] reductase